LFSQLLVAERVTRQATEGAAAGAAEEPTNESLRGDLALLAHLALRVALRRPGLEGEILLLLSQTLEVWNVVEVAA
jgi:hypothetical protein